MTMVKLPDLESLDVRRIIEALDHYCANMHAAQRDDVHEYEKLKEMFSRRAKLA